MRSQDLPDYSNPPVNEVAIGVVFEEIPNFTNIHHGLLWQIFRESYPTARSVPYSKFGRNPSDELMPVIEDMFNNRSNQGSPIRSWFLSKDEAFLLQIQHNQFVRNWRKLQDSQYPHFDTLLLQFYEDFERFKNFLVTEQLKTPTIRRLEVTYINWIDDISVIEFFKAADVAKVTTPGLGPTPDNPVFLSRYLAKPNGNELIGELIIQCQPATIPSDDKRGYQFSLVFRTTDLDNPTKEIQDELFEYGRTAIVRTFTDLTTNRAHAKWRLIK